MREICMLRSTRRGLETWHGRDGVTLAGRKGETTGNTNFDLHRRASPRPNLIAAGCAFAAASAGAATTDDVKWINQCVADNKGGAADEVVLKYCTCMNNKMSDNETQSISQWEKTHKTEMEACSKQAGWK